MSAAPGCGRILRPLENRWLLRRMCKMAVWYVFPLGKTFCERPNATPSGVRSPEFDPFASVPATP
jgi:hypothetical protein